MHISKSTKLSAAQQVHVLKKLIHRVVQRHPLSNKAGIYYDELILSFVTLSKSQQNENQKLLAHVSAIKNFIEQLEQDNEDTELLNAIEEEQLYKILYHNPQHKGIDDSSGLKALIKLGFIGVGVSAVCILFFALCGFLAAPGWLMVIATGLFAASATYLGALVYGVINDLYATKSNLPYFLLGHQPQQASLLRTNDPKAQGIAWGVAATFGPALIAAILFGLAATITTAFVPFATILFPVLLISMPLIAWGADKYAKQKARHYVEQGYEHYGDLRNVNLGSNTYQQEALKTMSGKVEDKANWLANSDRNVFGFTKLPLIGLGALIGMITLSATSSLLPIALFSTTLAIACPVAFAAVAVVFLVIAGLYMHRNRDLQVDNRYKLSFESGYDATYRPYFDEDMDIVAALSSDFVEKKPEPVLQKPQEPIHQANPVGGFFSTAKKFFGFGDEDQEAPAESPAI